MIAVSGATGQLGRLVIDGLLKSVPATEIVALARKPETLQEWAVLGVSVRVADYDRPETLEPALDGVGRLLMISGSEVGQRTRQHQAVIDAAKAAGVGLIAYTSILHADSSPVALAVEHRATEAALAASGVPHVLLRNGWYAENYTGSVPVALEHGVVLGSSGDGRISAATRADYAAGAVAVLTDGKSRAGEILELGGDEAFTLAEFAAEIARQAGKPVVYQDMPQVDYRAALVGVGLPEGLAELVSDASAGSGTGALFDDSRTLSGLIGRPTTPLPEVVAAALAAVQVSA